MNLYGVIPEPGTVHFERLLPGPIERVWRYLTESELRRQWLAAGDMELREGGRVEHVFHNATLTENDDPPPPKYAAMNGEVRLVGQIIECDPPYVIAYTWGGEDGSTLSDSVVRMELTPKGEQVLLVLTHRRIDTREAMLSIAGGWHTHLGILADRLSGKIPDGFWRTHTRLEAEYERRIPGVIGESV